MTDTVSNLELGRMLVEQACRMKVNQAEAVIFTDEFSTIRFNNSIHQHISANNSGVYLTVIVDGNRKGTISISSLDQSFLDKGLQQVVKIAKLAHPDNNFQSLPESIRIEPLSGLYIENTSSLSTYEKCECVKSMVDWSHDYDKRIDTAAGYFVNGFREVAIANSIGIECTTKISHAEVQANVISKDNGSIGSGYSAASNRDVSKIDLEKIIEEASKSSIASLQPHLTEPGEYEVVLKPYAVSVLLSCLGDGFSAVSYREGRSFLNDSLGKQVFDEKFTLIDDGRNPSTLTAMPFDGEGTPKKRIILIRDGVPEGICYDHYYSKLDKKVNTGHKPHKIDRMDGWVYQDPIPTNQIVEPGDSSEEDQISDVKKGLLVTRLHYVTVVDEKATILSGMTRDGTWFIQDGEVKYPVKNMRFTDTVVRALSKIEQVGDKSTVKSCLREHSGLLSSITAPSLKLASLRFTGLTEF